MLSWYLSLPSAVMRQLTLSGGQCDLTSSNSSFGEFGLVSKGVGDETSSSTTDRLLKLLRQVILVEQMLKVTDIGDKKVTLTGVGTRDMVKHYSLMNSTSVEKIKINGGSG